MNIMEKEKALEDVGIALVTAQDCNTRLMVDQQGLDQETSHDKSPRKRIAGPCDTSCLNLQVKKTHLDSGLNANDTMVVVELAHVEDGDRLGEDSDRLALAKASDKSVVQSAAAEYFEFIKNDTEDGFQTHSQHLIEKLSKSPSSAHTISSENDKDGLSTPQDQQQYYIAVDARTVATLQAGAEYTLVPVEQSTKSLANDDRLQNSFEDERNWNSNDTAIKVNDGQPQQLLMQTMRPISNTPDSPQLRCNPQEAHNVSTSQNTESSFPNINNGIFTSSNEEPNNSGKALQALPQIPTSAQQQLGRNCNPAVSEIANNGSPMLHAQMSLATRFHTPTSSAATGYPIMPTPHPHLMYNSPHPGVTGGSFGLPAHRLHLPPPNPAWASPYQQNFSPKAGQNFLTPQNNNTVSNLSLNSSGEEAENVSPEYPRVPHNTPNTDGNIFPITAIQRPPTMSQILGPLDNMQYFPIPYTGRENHNEKERKRRSRIKNACSLLRDLVPGLSEKTDKATVFEYTVQYLLHLKRHVGKQFDKEFMEKYTPY